MMMMVVVVMMMMIQWCDRLFHPDRDMFEIKF